MDDPGDGSPSITDTDPAIEHDTDTHTHPGPQRMLFMPQRTHACRSGDGARLAPGVEAAGRASPPQWHTRHKRRQRIRMTLWNPLAWGARGRGKGAKSGRHVIHKAPHNNEGRDGHTYPARCDGMECRDPLWAAEEVGVGRWLYRVW